MHRGPRAFFILYFVTAIFRSSLSSVPRSMRFAHPTLLWLTPVLVGVLWTALVVAARRRSAALAAFAGGRGRAWARPNASVPRGRWDLLLTLAAFAFLLLTLARPLVFRRNEANELQGVPYLIALDASRSMLATDVRPTRWAAATNALDKFLADTRADRIGLITFSGAAYLTAPLTFDTTALRTTLRYLDPNAIEDAGSSLAAALERAGRYFTSNQVPQRIVLVVSDGEDLVGNPVDTARRLNRQLKLQVSTVGVGTAAGARVPVNRYYGGVAKNSFGQEVTSRLNEGNLQRLATATGGRYFRLGDQGEGLEKFRAEVLAPLAETAAREDMKNYGELFQVPLALALACLLGKVLLAADRFAVARRLPSIGGADRWTKKDA